MLTGWNVLDAHNLHRRNISRVGWPILVARFTAACRIAIGAAFVAQPQVWMRPWIGRDARRPTARLLARGLGVRDLVLGIGTLASGAEQRRWLAAALTADTTDLLLTIASREHLPPRGRALVVAIAGSGVTLGSAALASGGRRD
jgi:hypothetical protein